MLKKMTIGTKIQGAFGLAAFLLPALLALTAASLFAVTGTVRTLTETRMPNLRDLATIEEAQTDVSRAVLALANEDTQGEFRTELYSSAQAAFERMGESWSAFDKRAKVQRTADLFHALKEPFAAWREAAQNVLALEKARDAVGSPGSPAYREATKPIAASLLAYRESYRVPTKDLCALKVWVEELSALPRRGRKAQRPPDACKRQGEDGRRSSSPFPWTTTGRATSEGGGQFTSRVRPRKRGSAGPPETSLVKARRPGQSPRRRASLSSPHRRAASLLGVSSGWACAPGMTHMDRGPMRR
jgi:Four helix bundle sensory module for signal transduction